MVINSTVIKAAGSKGEMHDCVGTYWQAGALMSGNINVPLRYVYFITLQDIASGVGSAACSGTTKPLAISFPYSTGLLTTNVPVHACTSGVSGIWWAFGKGA